MPWQRLYIMGYVDSVVAKKIPKEGGVTQISPFAYLDYREYLLAWFEAKKQESPWYSLRLMGAGVGLDPSQVYRILQKQLHVSKAALPRFESYLGLEGAAALYFRKLYQFARSNKEDETREIFGQILTMRGSRATILDEEQSRLYENWYHPIIRALVGVCRIHDNYEVLARSTIPPITATQVKKSLELLRRLRLVERDTNGCWKVCESGVVTGERIQKVMVRKYQENSLQLAAESLETVAKEQRDINVINMALDEEAFRDCVQILSEAREQMRRRIEAVDKPTKVMRLAQAFFPVAKIPEGK